MNLRMCDGKYVRHNSKLYQISRFEIICGGNVLALYVKRKGKFNKILDLLFPIVFYEEEIDNLRVSKDYNFIILKEKKI